MPGAASVHAQIDARLLVLGATSLIGRFLLTPGGCDELCTLFAGRVALDVIGDGGLIGHQGLDSEQEDIRVRALPADHVIEQALAGAYPNSVATIGLLWFAARRDWLRSRWSAA